VWKWLTAFFSLFKKKPRAITGSATLSAGRARLVSEGQQDVYDVGNEDER
jgi:hypothetical protein